MFIREMHMLGNMANFRLFIVDSLLIGIYMYYQYSYYSENLITALPLLMFDCESLHLLKCQLLPSY